MEQTKNLSLRQKLFEIQKKHQTFAQTEGSDKKANGKPDKSAYSYTPGWKIVESIREAMDEMGIMLDSTQVDERHEMISYYVYKEIAGKIIPFEKREMYVTVKREYTWTDVQTGETLGPFLQVAAGANGTDKSIASAESLCQRYFLLKFFNITTHEKDDEPDAHDSSNIPGNLNYPEAKEYNVGRGYAPVQQAPQQPTVQQPVQQPQSTEFPFGQEQSRQISPSVNPYEAAVLELANFGKGTQSHTNILNKWMTALNQAGYNTAEPSFAANLIESAQARREHRTPVYR